MGLLYPYGGALVAPFAAMYVTSVLSRLQIKRGRRPNWAAAVVSLAFGVLIAWLCSFQLDTFMPWRWCSVGGKVYLGDLLSATASLSLMTSAIPALFIMRRYQKKYDKSNHRRGACETG